MSDACVFLFKQHHHSDIDWPRHLRTPDDIIAHVEGVNPSRIMERLKGQQFAKVYVCCHVSQELWQSLYQVCVWRSALLIEVTDAQQRDAREAKRREVALAIFEDNGQ